MEILLSANQPLDENIQWYNHIGIFDQSVLESEARKIVCDDFLSKFSQQDIDKVMSIIFKKMRIGCQLVVKDVDLYSLSKLIYRGGGKNEDVNARITNGVKSFLTIEKIQSLLPQGFVVAQKFIEEKELSFVVAIERVA